MVLNDCCVCVFVKACSTVPTVAGDIVDNDCDGLVDEEILNGIGESSVFSTDLKKLDRSN